MDPWFLLEAAKRGYDAWVKHGAAFSSSEFVAAYSKANAASQAVIRSIDQLDEDGLKEGARAVLRLIVQVMEAYHRKDVGINANYMVPVPSTAQTVRDARFLLKNRREDSFRCFLKLVDWAYPSPDFPTLLLPVEHADERIGDSLLFGAPCAFVNLKSYLVNDTTHIYMHTGGLNQEAVRVEIKNYFDSHRDRVRSFISIPVVPPTALIESGVCGPEALAVVNVHCSKPYLMGRFVGNQRNLDVTLAPLVNAFAYFAHLLHGEEAAGTLDGETAV